MKTDDGQARRMTHDPETVEPPKVCHDAREAANHLALLLEMDKKEGIAALEKICAAAKSYSNAALSALQPAIDIADQLNDPSSEIYANYWASMPSPYELDCENHEAAKRHILAVLNELGALDRPAETEGE